MINSAAQYIQISYLGVKQPPLFQETFHRCVLCLKRYTQRQKNQIAFEFIWW